MQTFLIHNFWDSTQSAIKLNKKWKRKFQVENGAFLKVNCFFHHFNGLFLSYRNFYFLSRAVERMVDFIRGPGKILKYDPKKVNFALLGPFFGLGPGKNYRLSPPSLRPCFCQAIFNLMPMNWGLEIAWKKNKVTIGKKKSIDLRNRKIFSILSPTNLVTFAGTKNGL